MIYPSLLSIICIPYFLIQSLNNADMSFLQAAAFWFKDRSDMTHHGVALAGTAVGVALLRKASPVALAATSISAVSESLVDLLV